MLNASNIGAPSHPSAARAQAVASWKKLRRLIALTALLVLFLLAWDASGFDLPLARMMGGSHQFEWRDNRLLVLALHEVPRAISMVLVVALLVGVVIPWGFLRRLGAGDRAQLALSVLGGIALSTLVKRLSATSCPWDLLQFGGSLPYVSHWAWGTYDGGAGHCFPAGHASAAFCFVGAWFVLRRAAPASAPRWLVVAVVAGLVLGLAQQVRGAHYVSHTLWTAWICWTVGLLGECLRALTQRARTPGSAALKVRNLNET